MSQKTPIKENTYEIGVGGVTAPGWGTHTSPDNRQDSANFPHNDDNKAIGSQSNLATGVPADPSQLDKTVDQIYGKAVTPSPDEVMCGLDYELQRMTKKDKALAKSKVLNNLKQDPHYYGKLGMLNINDKDMMKNEPLNKSEEQMQERIKLLNKMLEAKGKKAETPQSFKDALAETKAKKDSRYVR